jgi:hypothetical protein
MMNDISEALRRFWNTYGTFLEDGLEVRGFAFMKLHGL